jgi:hypothetical protein
MTAIRPITGTDSNDTTLRAIGISFVQTPTATMLLLAVLTAMMQRASTGPAHWTDAACGAGAARCLRAGLGRQPSAAGSHAGPRTRDDGPTRLARAIRLGVPVTVQHPLLFGLAAPLTEYWGSEQVRDVFPLREWVEQGALLAAGSDYPNGSYHAMTSVWGVVTRQTPLGVIGPEHAISRYEAVRLHTTDAARLAGDRDRRGTLAPGMLADLVGYPAGPLTAGTDALPTLNPAFTMVAGVAVTSLIRGRMPRSSSCARSSCRWDQSHAVSHPARPSWFRRRAIMIPRRTSPAFC